MMKLTLIIRTMPSNTIMHYMSIGGVAMGTCHGGGIGHKTIADR